MREPHIEIHVYKYVKWPSLGRVRVAAGIALKRPRDMRMGIYIQILALALTSFAVALHSNGEPAKTYIVHMAKWQMPASFATHERWYASKVKSLPRHEEEEEEPSILYNYDAVFHGFAGKLSAKQAEALQEMEGILSVYPETVYELHTTRTPDFLGLNADQGLWPDSSYGNDVIVGVLDTGIWPESKSFDDRGLSAVPARWKGICQEGTQFNTSLCNRKLIGARFYSSGYEAVHGPINENDEYRSPRDQEGHGSHTASTAAGGFVEGASLMGYAEGTARGMATNARIAAYKVCWEGGCFSSDILAAMDQAIEDGVDVLSLSLGGGIAPYYRDGIAIGAFAATERGIFVSCSAGNAGPDPMSISNGAPWIATVGASTLDRDFPAYAVLGNGKKYKGVSLYSGDGLGNSSLPLVYPLGANSSKNLCLDDTLDPKLVAGKIVLCDRGITARVDKGAVVKAAGGAGMILANTAANGEELVADCHLLPATAVGQKNGDEIREYIRTAANPSASLEFQGTVLGIKPSPVVAAFSSRGPNGVGPEILKPDVIGPGVNILAAWSGFEGPTNLKKDKRRVSYNIISGTSMSCPHVSGIAALLKAAHPDWSPAALKSALMTTAYTVDNAGNALQDVATGRASTPFDHGAGHVDPQRALQPGLIYDIGVQDYIEFLCALGYTRQQIGVLAKRNFTCDQAAKPSAGDLNYPSFSVVFRPDPSSDVAVKQRRTVRNVGPPGSRYVSASSSPSPLVSIAVEPATLYFAERNETQAYTVAFVAKPGAGQVAGSQSFGSLTWTNGGQHTVRSPISFTWKQAEISSGRDWLWNGKAALLRGSMKKRGSFLASDS